MICETTTSRVYKHLIDDNFAIISPYKYERDILPDKLEKQNKSKLKQFKHEIRNQGYGYIELVARWVEENELGDLEYSDEHSLLIPNLPKDLAMKYGKQYNQSSIIIKDDNGCKEICTTPFIDWQNKKYNVGDTVRTFNLDANDKGVMNIEDAKEIFTKRKGGPASKPLKDERPFTLKEVYEVEEPRPSYFQSQPTMRLVFNFNVEDDVENLEKFL